MTEKSVENKEISEPTSNVENSIKTAEKATSEVLESPEKTIKMSQLNSSIKKGKVRKMFKGEPYTGPVIDYDENRVKSMTGYYKDGLRDGKWTYFYQNGQLEQKGKYSNDGLKKGKWKAYHSNGNLKEIGLFDHNGDMTGKWKYYDELGNFKDSKIY